MCEGGLGLCLNRAWKIPDKLRAEARSLLRSVAGEPEAGDEELMAESMLGSERVNAARLKRHTSCEMLAHHYGKVQVELASPDLHEGALGRAQVTVGNQRGRTSERTRFSKDMLKSSSQVGPVERAALLLHAADIAEEREELVIGGV